MMIMLGQRGLVMKKERKAKIGRIMKRDERIFLDLKCRLRLKRMNEMIVRTRRDVVMMSIVNMLLHMMNEARRDWK